MSQTKDGEKTTQNRAPDWIKSLAKEIYHSQSISMGPIDDGLTMDEYYQRGYARFERIITMHYGPESATHSRLVKALERAEKVMGDACILLEADECCPDADIALAANKANAEIRATLAAMRPLISAAHKGGTEK